MLSKDAKPARAEREHEWCQRCVRSIGQKGSDIDAIHARGCTTPAGLTRCRYCSDGRHDCVPVPPRFYRAVDDLVNSVAFHAARIPMISVDEIRAAALRIDKGMMNNRRLQAKTAPLAGVTTSAGPVGANATIGLTDHTGQLILHAIRELVKVQAHAASVDLPDWPEKEEFDAGIDFSGLHGV